jgi:hypothetical protein
MYQFKWQLCTKNYFWFLYDANKPQVIENKICECTNCMKAALSSGVTSQQVMDALETIVGWGKNEGVTFLYLIPYPSAHMYRVQTQVSETFLINANYQNLH